MKIMIDTNILISAALFPGSIPYQAYMKAVTFPYQGMICDQNIDELKRIFNKKFPKRFQDLNNFILLAMDGLEVVRVPNDENAVAEESYVRDEKDRPILRSAIKYNANFILTGDKDFIESGIKSPQCISPSDFLCLN